MINRASLQAAFDLLEYLQGQGIQCIIAGGCARDIFFGVKPKDIDILVADCSVNELDNLLAKANVASRLYHFYGDSQSDRIVGPQDVIGSHVKGYNHESLGICMAGGIDASGKPENNFTPEQFAAVSLTITIVTVLTFVFLAVPVGLRGTTLGGRFVGHIAVFFFFTGPVVTTSRVLDELGEHEGVQLKLHGGARNAGPAVGEHGEADLALGAARDVRDVLDALALGVNHLEDNRDDLAVLLVAAVAGELEGHGAIVVLDDRQRGIAESALIELAEKVDTLEVNETKEPTAHVKHETWRFKKEFLQEHFKSVVYGTFKLFRRNASELMAIQINREYLQTEQARVRFPS